MREAPIPAADCPAAPPIQDSTHARALHRACLIVGGAQALAAHLNVAEAAVRLWMVGEQEPPEHVFLAAVELILLAADRPVGRAS